MLRRRAEQIPLTSLGRHKLCAEPRSRGYTANWSRCAFLPWVFDGRGGAKPVYMLRLVLMSPIRPMCVDTSPSTRPSSCAASLMVMTGGGAAEGGSGGNTYDLAKGCCVSMSMPEPVPGINYHAIKQALGGRDAGVRFIKFLPVRLSSASGMLSTIQPSIRSLKPVTGLGSLVF